MTSTTVRPAVRARDLEPILAVASKLAAPFDLPTMLSEVVAAALQVLDAERSAVWLYDAATDELVMEVSTDSPPMRIPATTGLAGACARTRKVINVRDCYADPRFDPSIDARSGRRTRCMLTLPLVDHAGVLVGVMQVLNRRDGVFDDKDESLATVLAAQCAVALQRVRMTQALLEGERMRQELEMARAVQMSSLPATMPALESYDVHALFEPADITGGDTFDLAPLAQGLLVVLADAAGHGIAPALSVTQMHAMLRMAFRLGADLDTVFTQVNNQLGETLPDDRFVTAFIGLLDTGAHRLRFHSGGQGPVLRLRAATDECEELPTTSFPLAAMRLERLRPAAILDMAPGDVLALLSDGVYEARNTAGEYFGRARVCELLARHHREPMAEAAALILEAVRSFAGGAAPEDDMTIVLVKRDPPGSSSRRFPRTFDSLAPMSRWTKDYFARERLDDSLRPSVDGALEELFTNMVKYGKGSQPVRVDIATIRGGVAVTLVDTDADDFDVTRAPDTPVDLPIEQRQPGGLGLHLTRRLVEGLEYRYTAQGRQARISFRKTAGGADAGD